MFGVFCGTASTRGTLPPYLQEDLMYYMYRRWSKHLWVPDTDLRHSQQNDEPRG